MALPFPKPCSVKQGYESESENLDGVSLMLMIHWAEQVTIPLWDPWPPWQSERLEGFRIHAGEMAERNEPRVL